MVQDLGSVPAFASYPSANHTIYLDFNGHTTTGTAWNTTKWGSEIYTPAYNTDGSGSVFSVGEQIAIREIFNSVAEDFAPFAVNVTTIEPPIEDLKKTTIQDTRWGVRVAIGGTYLDWYGIGNSGTAFTSSFNSQDDMPAFVFAETLSYQTQWIAETISHEVGHTLGLSHDGGPGTSYYLGHGVGATGWASIMGGSYYKPVTQWDKGEFPGATNVQDDLAIITGNNGFGYRPDDYVAPFMLAGDLTAAGVIERNTDVDVFAWMPSYGDKPGSKLIQQRIVIDPAQFIANLDIKARLYNAAGVLLYESAPLDQLNIDFTITLRVGQVYYLHVEGDGSANYSDYGSLGYYKLGISRP